MKTKTVRVTYQFKISYSHIDQLKSLIKDLEEAPIPSQYGFDKDGLHGCEQIGRGKLQK